MSGSMDVIKLLEAGIKAEGLRQNTIASNIANLETPGYRRLDIKFQEMLAQAVRSSDKLDPRDVEPETYQPQNTPIRSNGNDVNLEVEIGAMLKNSLRHAAYVRLLGKKLAQMETAMGVGQ